jgi:hypothetical protein
VSPLEPRSKQNTKQEAKPASASGALGEARELVIMVPGFLGFERLGGFAYFADHLAATLRASLESRTRRRTPVIPLGTLPAGSLVARQAVLLEQLVYWNQRLRPQRIHLVAHSSGGVDAYFATAATTLSGSAWTAEQQEARKRIATIACMGTPFLGTTLSDSEVARFLAGSRHLPPSLREVVGISTGLFHLLKENEASLERLAAIARGIPAAAGMVTQLACHRELIGELSPRQMLERYQKLERDLQPKLACFASFVEPPEPAHSSSFFRRLYGYTAQHTENPIGGELLDANKKLLEGARVIRGATAARVALSASSNDGVVNTLRQLPPGARAEDVAGVVIADHADLLGYFDRVDPRTGQESQISIFRSGATFRDDQFFELFDAVAQRLT